VLPPVEAIANANTLALTILLGQALAVHGLLVQHVPVGVDDDHTVTHYALLIALFPAADALHGSGHPHGDDGRGIVAGVVEATLERWRRLCQLGDLLAIAVSRFRQLGEVRCGLKGAALVLRCRYTVALGIGTAQA